MAGAPVSVAGRVIQRCLVCGEKLCDSLNTAAPLNPDGTPPAFPTWGQGRLIQFDGNRQADVGDFVSPDPLPDDFCWELVE